MSSLEFGEKCSGGEGGRCPFLENMASDEHVTWFCSLDDEVGCPRAGETTDLGGSEPLFDQG